jgi:hypothetical protein
METFSAGSCDYGDKGTDMAKLIRAFRNTANAPTNGHDQGHNQRGGGVRPLWAAVMIIDETIKNFFAHHFLNY